MYLYLCIVFVQSALGMEAVCVCVWPSVSVTLIFMLLYLVPIKTKVSVLVEEIYFANGLELDPSENFLLFCETGMARVHK